MAGNMESMLFGESSDDSDDNEGLEEISAGTLPSSAAAVIAAQVPAPVPTGTLAPSVLPAVPAPTAAAPPASAASPPSNASELKSRLKSLYSSSGKSAAASSAPSPSSAPGAGTTIRPGSTATSADGDGAAKNASAPSAASQQQQHGRLRRPGDSYEPTHLQSLVPNRSAVSHPGTPSLPATGGPPATSVNASNTGLSSAQQQPGVGQPGSSISIPSHSGSYVSSELSHRLGMAGGMQRQQQQQQQQQQQKNPGSHQEPPGMVSNAASGAPTYHIVSSHASPNHTSTAPTSNDSAHGLPSSSSTATSGSVLTSSSANTNPSLSQAERQTQLERETKQRKERFLLFTRVLMKYLEQKDPPMHSRAKAVIKDCAAKSKAGNPEYVSLTSSMHKHLRQTVGELYWGKAEDYLRHCMKQKELQKRLRDGTVQPGNSSGAMGEGSSGNNIPSESGRTASELMPGLSSVQSSSASQHLTSSSVTAGITSAQLAAHAKARAAVAGTGTSMLSSQQLPSSTHHSHHIFQPSMAASAPVSSLSTSPSPSPLPSTLPAHVVAKMTPEQKAAYDRKLQIENIQREAKQNAMRQDQSKLIAARKREEAKVAKKKRTDLIKVQSLAKKKQEKLKRDREMMNNVASAKARLDAPSTVGALASPLASSAGGYTSVVGMLPNPGLASAATTSVLSPATSTAPSIAYRDSMDNASVASINSGTNLFGGKKKKPTAAERRKNASVAAAKNLQRSGSTSSLMTGVTIGNGGGMNTLEPSTMVSAGLTTGTEAKKTSAGDSPREYAELMEMVDHAAKYDWKSSALLLGMTHRSDLNLAEEQKRLLYGDNSVSASWTSQPSLAAVAVRTPTAGNSASVPHSGMLSYGGHSVDGGETVESNGTEANTASLPPHLAGWGKRNIVSSRMAWAKVRLLEQENKESKAFTLPLGQKPESTLLCSNGKNTLLTTSSSTGVSDETKVQSSTDSLQQSSTTWYNEEKAEEDKTLALVSEAVELYIKSILENAVNASRQRQNIDGIRLWHQQHSTKEPPLSLRLGCDVRRQLALVSGNAAKTCQRMEEALSRQTKKRPSSDLSAVDTLYQATSMSDLATRPKLASAASDAEYDAKCSFEIFGGRGSGVPPFGRVPKKAKLMVKDLRTSVKNPMFPWQRKSFLTKGLA